VVTARVSEANVTLSSRATARDATFAWIRVEAVSYERGVPVILDRKQFLMSEVSL